MQTETIFIVGALLLSLVVVALIWLAIHNARKPSPYGLKELLEFRAALRDSKDTREWFGIFSLVVLGFLLRRVISPIAALTLASTIIFVFLSYFVPGIFGEDLKTARCMLFDVLISFSERMIDTAPTYCEYTKVK